jgi:thiamine biosynthesis protein ThiS
MCSRDVRWKYWGTPLNTLWIQGWMIAGTQQLMPVRSTCSWRARGLSLRIAKSFSHGISESRRCSCAAFTPRADILLEMASGITIQLNGSERHFEELGDSPMIAALVASLGLRADRVALEQNGEIVPRSTWDDVPVQTGDRIELVHFVGGGAS